MTIVYTSRIERTSDDIPDVNVEIVVNSERNFDSDVVEQVSVAAMDIFVKATAPAPF